MCDDIERPRGLRALAQGLGYQFHDLSLLDRALTHASTASELEQPPRNYEALEFLGDAVLGLAVAHALYERAPDGTPGEHSRMRAALVNRRCLARQAQRLGIAPHIRLGRGEEQAGGRSRTALLADCLEALVAAVYLDQGWDAARTFVERMFREEVDRTVALDRVWDYKSRLQHHCQAAHMALPVFTVVRSRGPDHLKEFEVEVRLRGEPAGHGVGLTKKEAEQNAARAALEHEGVATTDCERFMRR